MDSLLVTVVILVITALSSWLQRKGQSEEPGSFGDEWKTLKPRKSAPPPVARGVKTDSPARAERPAPTLDWEKELRRLLQGEAPTSSPPPLSQPQPPLISREVAPPPPIPPPVAPAQRIPAPFTPEPEEAPQPMLARMSESAAAYQKAQQLHDAVAGRLRKVDELTEQHRPAAPVRHVQALSEVRSAVSLLRRPGTARQAIITALILSPPKALEQEGH